MATTYDFTDGSIAGVPVMTQTTLRENEPTILRNILDFSLQTLTAADSDVAKALIIPADTTVLNAWIRVITKETANGSCDLGITGVNVDQWGDACDLATAADAIVGGTLAAPYFFATADTIDVLVTADGAAVDLDGAKIEVCALCVKSLDTY